MGSDVDPNLRVDEECGWAHDIQSGSFMWVLVPNARCLSRKGWELWLWGPVRDLVWVHLLPRVWLVPKMEYWGYL